MNIRLPLIRWFLLTTTVLIEVGTAHSQFNPVNDMFANSTVIAGTNIVVNGLSFYATKEAGEPDHAGNSGGASIWWSWQAPTTGFVTISTAGSSFDTLLGVYAGTSVSALTTIASNDDNPDTGDYTSQVTFTAVANQVYQIAVDGYEGAYGFVTLSVLQAPPPPPPPAPAWLAPDPYGVTVNSSDCAGKVILLNFWATWCNPCKAEMPDLVTLQDKYRADGLVIVGADTGWSGDTASVVQSFLATWTPAINYQVVMANAAMIQAYGNIGAIPTTFIIDRQNVIQKEYVGTQSFSTFETEIIPLLYGNTQIGCQRNGNQMTLCWPANAAAFVLQSATNLASPIWSDWPIAPTVVNGTNTMQVPLIAPPCYFRLRMAY